MKKDLKQSLKVGGLAGLISASCCTIPLLLMILGISSVAAGAMNAQLSSLRWSLLIPVGLAIAAYGIYRKVKETDKVCNLETLKKNKVFAITTIILTLIIWAILVYAIIPILWKLVAN